MRSSRDRSRQHKNSTRFDHVRDAGYGQPDFFAVFIFITELRIGSRRHFFSHRTEQFDAAYSSGDPLRDGNGPRIVLLSQSWLLHFPDDCQRAVQIIGRPVALDSNAQRWHA
jgi:hypothetical protein